MIKRLWIYPALMLVAVAFAFIVAGMNGPLVNPGALREFNFLSAAGNDLEYFPPGLLEMIPEGESEVVDLPDDVLDYSFSFLSRRKGYEDLWGASYRVIREKREGEDWIGIFSLGHDGISKSGGNDPDDLNTWDQNSVDFYVDSLNRYLRKRRIKDMWIFFPIILVGLLTFFEMMSWLKANRMPEEDTVTF